MNIDHILQTMNSHQVEYIVIGGINFLLRHKSIVTYDIDLWVNDTPENLKRCEQALTELEAEWGPTDETWTPVAEKRAGWLSVQSVFCMTSPHGAVDVFRSVKGLGTWDESCANSAARSTKGGIPYRGLSDGDMLQCQIALPEGSRHEDRIRILKKALGLTDNNERIT